MIGLGLCVFAAVGAYILVRRDVGQGVGWVFAVGYFYGILRANFLDGVSHFMFDAGLLGLFTGYFTRKWQGTALRQSLAVRKWFTALAFWPMVMVLISPLLDSQHLFIQLVGLRAAVLMLPAVLIGARLTQEDVDTISAWVVGLNLVAFGMAVVEFQLGVERFFPQNAATIIIYNSNDAGPGGALRIPSIFSSAHAYGGTMVMSLPFLVHRLMRGKTRALVLAALGASVLGAFICAARSPVLILAGTAALVMVSARITFRTVMLAVVMVGGVSYIVATNERFQRFTTLSDTGYVESRVGTSVNLELVDIVLEYPLGAGLGSAAGTSVPFFLADYVRPQVGLESELSRVTLEQGVLGMCLWVSFVLWTLGRSTRANDVSPMLARRAIWGVMLGIWGTALIGTGMMTSIPQTLMLLLMMGMLGRSVPARTRAQPQVAPPTPQAPSAPRLVRE